MSKAKPTKSKLKHELVKLKYKFPEKVEADINAAIGYFSSLKPKTEKFTLHTGATRDLACLEGTVCIQFMGNTYNIPICLFLMDNHPSQPPVVYVRPTSTMQIKQGKHVDANGLIYLPYLNEWTAQNSDLHGLLSVLQIVFSDQPPVFSKVAASTPVIATSATPASEDENNELGRLAAWAQGEQTPTYSTNTIKPEHLRLSLVSAVGDKLRWAYNDAVGQHQAEIDSLLKIQADLLRGRDQLTEMLERMDKEKAEVENCLDVWQVTTNQLRQQWGTMQVDEQDVPDVDQWIDATSVVYRQIVVSFAEEQAIDDAVYYLGEALGNSVIDVETFLKKVRELYRKQFMLRATIDKCRERAGLSPLQ